MPSVYTSRFYILLLSASCVITACIMPPGSYPKFESDTTSKPQAEKPEYDWFYEGSIDRMTSDSVYTASVQSKNRLYYSSISKRKNYSNTMPILSIIKRNNGEDLGLSIEGTGQSIIFHTKDDSVKLTMRFDNKAPLKLIGRLPASGNRSFVFIDSSDLVIAKIKKSKHLLIKVPLVYSKHGVVKKDRYTGVTYYQNSHNNYISEILEYNIEGLKW